MEIAVYAKYLRVSKEDRELQKESNSIANQRELLNAFIKAHPDFLGYQGMEFVDDGYSGVHFKRPAVKEMLDLAMQGSLQCILVKDLSRFGRDFLTVGEYLERIFPERQIRFIAVNDGYDSGWDGNRLPAMDIAYKNLFNTFYSEYLSANIRASLLVKRESGEHIGAGAPYGYQKKPGCGNRLFPDPEPAGVVRAIFCAAAKGMKKQEIADWLNRLGILTPGDYKERKRTEGLGLPFQQRRKWKREQIRLIIQNETYRGTAIYGKFCKKTVGSPLNRSIKKEDWTRVFHAHEPIVSEELFAKVNKPS